MKVILKSVNPTASMILGPIILKFPSNVSVNIFQDQSNDARRPVIKLLICSISLHLKSETIRKLETTTVKLSDEEIAEFRMNKLKEILQFTENML